MIPPAAAPKLRRALPLHRKSGIRIEKPEIFSASLRPVPVARPTDNIFSLKLLVGLSYLFSLLSLVFLFCARFLAER